MRLKEYLVEEINVDLGMLIKKWVDRGVRLTAVVKKNRQIPTIEILDLVISKDERNKGIGSNVIRELIDFADERGYRLELTPAVKDDRMGTTSKNRLQKFYSKFGFVKNIGRHIDYSTSAGMYRDPQKHSIWRRK
ncbi:MAG TPA: GNAT family N-acetyltransferase [Bacteroidales bacterium]|nr:GNAT family N-acetyltransferase [Bacteroidales bacterium]